MSKYQEALQKKLDELKNLLVKFCVCGIEPPQGLIESICLYEIERNIDVLRKREMIENIKQRRNKHE